MKPTTQQTSSPALADTLRQAPVLRRGDYDYFVHALTDGVLPVQADVLDAAAEDLARRMPPRTDVLLTAEAMGIPLATALTQRTRIPFLVARKRAYGLPGEVRVPYETGYSRGHLHVNGLRPGQRVVLVDDVLSGGGTVRALARAVREAGATLAKILVFVNKDHDLAALARDVGAPVEALATIRVADGAVHVLE